MSSEQAPARAPGTRGYLGGKSDIPGTTEMQSPLVTRGIPRQMHFNGIYRPISSYKNVIIDFG